MARRRDVVRIGCGAGFAGDRPIAALRLLERVPDLQYLVLECLAERTLTSRYEAMVAGGKGYDPRISEWMRLLLPTAISKGVCIITNMGAVDPVGAQEEVLQLVSELGLSLIVAVAYELPQSYTVSSQSNESKDHIGGCSTYLGAAPIVHALKTSKADIIITSRVADAALFLAPMVYELDWKWQDFEYLAQGALAGHLLECGCQLTGGYFMHPADPHRSFSAQQLLNVSLPYADVTWDGSVTLGKAENSGGELSIATCAQQLLYEIGDPTAYITPDVIVNFNNVTFQPLSADQVVAKGARPATQSAPKDLLQLIPRHCGWKGWGEISYGGSLCKERAAAAEFLVRAWVEETNPDTSHRILSYHVGEDSLRVCSGDESARTSPNPHEVRLRMDGLFETRVHASTFIHEFEALYTNGPAGGGGVRTGLNHDLLLHKSLIPRELVQWETSVRRSSPKPQQPRPASPLLPVIADEKKLQKPVVMPRKPLLPAPAGVELPLYKVAHGRTGDKGNQLNVSIIPHCPSDVAQLRSIITPSWVVQVMKHLFPISCGPNKDLVPMNCGLNVSHESIATKRQESMMEALVDVYEVQGVEAFNVVVKDVLDGGVTCSRRLDRHGKSLSDLILSQFVILPS